MKTLKILSMMALLAGSASGFAPAQEKANRPPGGDRFRFLYLAVFEGLIEDGVQKETVQRVLDPDTRWFIINCPICTPVHFAFDVYRSSLSVQSWTTGELPPGHGPGLSKDEAARFASTDVVTRHGALKTLIDRYVERRFARVNMTDKEKDRLRESIKIGMKEGLEQLKGQDRQADFPSSCPSCEGAN